MKVCPALTKLIPMKRELKGYTIGRPASLITTHKANPYEKGTESLPPGGEPQS